MDEGGWCQVPQWGVGGWGWTGEEGWWARGRETRDFNNIAKSPKFLTWGGGGGGGGGGVRGCRTQCYSWAFVLGIFSGHALAAASQQSRSCSSKVLSSSV
jgi:hypothetical protein